MTLSTQAGPGAPPGNRNAARSGLWATRPDVRVSIPPNVSMGALAEHALSVGEGASMIAEQLTAIAAALDEGRLEAEILGEALFTVEELDQMIVLYAKVAGEADEFAGELMGRQGVRVASLGTMESGEYGRMVARSARYLSLMMSRAASAVSRMQTSGVVVASRERDRGRALSPTLGELAKVFRTILRQMKTHAGFLAWQAGDAVEAESPAMVLEQS